jgi:three-Cys-motif partner protein
MKLSDALKDQQKSLAALVFLDPFGMQINWESIASLKGTRSDVWILIPTGVIVNRLLDRNCKLKHTEILQSFFGISEAEIKEYFYKTETQNTLFGEQEFIHKINHPIEKIAELYTNRLKTIWPHVTEKPLKLENTKGVPIYHFVFASNNQVAVKIAKDIIKSK